jgi:ABC-type polar amino acid transport system ATPase subunit
MPEAPHTKAAHSAASQTSPMLSVRELQAWYGESHVLHGVDLDVYPGEVVTLLGRNGAGKTTTLKAIIPTATLLEHALLTQGFMGGSKAGFLHILQLQNRDSTRANLANTQK